MTSEVEEEEEDQSLKLALRQPWLCSVSAFIFLVSAWPFLSLAVSSSHRQGAVSVLIITGLASVEMGQKSW